MSQMEIDENGTKRWCNSKGKLHRKDGPALEFTDGSKYWCINGKCHREDGPSIENADGLKYWFIDGKEYSFDKWLDNLQVSNEEKVLLCLKWK